MAKDTRRQDFTTKEKKPRKSYYKPVDYFKVRPINVLYYFKRVKHDFRTG